MAILGDPVLLVAGMALLWFAGDRGVRYSVELAEILGISSFTVGFLIISVSTGLPEIATAVLSVVQKVAELSAGDLIGASLVNLTLVLGASAIAAGTLKVDRETEKTLVKILAVITIIASAVLVVKHLAWWHGVMLLLTYGLSVYYLSRTNIIEKIVREEEQEVEEKMEQETIGSGLKGTGVKLLGSIAILLVGSRLTVGSAVGLGQSLGIPLETMGATVVAVGTTLPELSLELNSVKKREYELAIGDIFGSTLVNLTLILGSLSLVAHPVVETLPLTAAIIFIGAALAVIWLRLIMNHGLGRAEGVLLIGIFLLYLLYEYSGLPLLHI